MYTISCETLVGIGLATALAAVILSAVTYILGYARGDRDKQGDIDGLTASLREAQDELSSATAAYDEETDRLYDRLQCQREKTRATVDGVTAERDQALKEADRLRLDISALKDAISIRDRLLAGARGQLAFARAKIDSWCSPDNRTSAASSALLEQPYVVIPTLAVAILPLEWRKRLIVLLDEAEDMGVNWPTGYNVIKRGAKGRAVKDAWNIGTGLMVRNGEGTRLAFETANGGPLKAGAGETP